MNRSEWMGNKWKNQNVGSYDWLPEVITRINPAPNYPDKALDDSMTKKGIKRIRFGEAMEKIKTGKL